MKGLKIGVGKSQSVMESSGDSPSVGGRAGDIKDPEKGRSAIALNCESRGFLRYQTPDSINS